MLGNPSIQVVTAGYTSERKRLAGQCHAENLPLQVAIAIWIASCEQNLGSSFSGAPSIQVLTTRHALDDICAAEVHKLSLHVPIRNWTAIV